jgi:hypothetical protein
MRVSSLPPFLTPETAKRLGLSPVTDSPKRTMTVIGGRQVGFPLVQLATRAVGHAEPARARDPPP